MGEGYSAGVIFKDALVFYVVIFVALALQPVIAWVVSGLQRKIQDSMDDLAKNFENSEMVKNFIDNERIPFSLVGLKRRSLGFITKIVGVIEFLIVFWITVLTVRGDAGFPNGITLIAATISGWLAIKVIGSYQQWSGPIWGRATFYVFLIGSILNFALAISTAILYQAVVACRCLVF